MHLLRVDGRELPFQNELFDLLFAFDVLEHIREFNNVLDEMARVLKTDGHAFITLPIEGAIRGMGRKVQRLGDPGHYKGVVRSDGELVGLLKEKFSLVEVWTAPAKLLPLYRLVLLGKQCLA